MTKEEVKATLQDMWECLFREMTNHTFEDLKEHGVLDKYAAAFNMMMLALDEKGDLISRGEVESVLHNNLHALIDTDQLYQLYKDINRLPAYSFPDSAKTPKNGERFSCPNCGFKADWYIPDSAENKGEWIDISTGKGIFKDRSVKCSKCGNTLNLDGVNCGRGDANFCPNCGADMRGKANE